MPATASEVFNAPIVRKIDGKDVEFPRLYMDFYGQLESTVRTNRNAVVTAACDAAQLVGKDKAQEVKSEGLKPITAEDVSYYIGTSGGVKRVLDKSLEVAGVEKADRDAIASKMDALTGIQLARLVMGFTYEALSDEEGLVDRQGPPESRDWPAERALILKHFPEVNPGRLTWYDYHLALAYARAKEPQ